MTWNYNLSLINSLIHSSVLFHAAKSTAGIKIHNS